MIGDQFDFSTSQHAVPFVMDADEFQALLDYPLNLDAPPNPNFVPRALVESDEPKTELDLWLESTLPTSDWFPPHVLDELLTFFEDYKNKKDATPSSPC
ncbi:hypothetical protein DSO57_1015223 [Entomophthora muscae]|uniref:Uncharacterized protein n=1 Tax=Entomophthora muscae TaxID=34485 RepID=A0ACC2TSU9_9FUNG|nr:hypothetical protein DSO57_1015223 [Entomophthora muscae]